MKKPTVLLVEDDEMLKDALEFQLAEMGLHVYSAANGEAAMKHLETSPEIRIVISDLNMPDMSGLDLIEQVKANQVPSYTERAFILMTGYHDKFDDERARQLGVTNFLAKPFDHEFLRFAIHNILFGPAESAA